MTERRTKPEWDDDFLDEMMGEVRDAVLELCRSRSKSPEDEVVWMRSERSVVTITVKREPAHA